MIRRHAIAVFALVVAGAGGCQREPVQAPARTTAASAPAAPPAQAAPAGDPWAAAPGKPQDAPKDRLPHPFLWAVEKDGHTTYLFGTIHLGVDAEAKLPDAVWQKLDAAKAFAMETDINDPGLVKELTARPHGGTLHEDLGEEYWKKLQAELTPQVAARLDRFPATIAVTLLETRGLPPVATPMDAVLLGRAKRNSARIVYLEPAHKQSLLLAKWLDVRALEELLDHEAVQEQMVKDLLAAYLAGDEAKMLALSDQDHTLWKQDGRSEDEYQQMQYDMLYERNASWIPELEQLHAAGGGFVAVGVRHLIGERSVIDLLQKRGYKVTRVGA